MQNSYSYSVHDLKTESLNLRFLENLWQIKQSRDFLENSNQYLGKKKNAFFLLNLAINIKIVIFFKFCTHAIDT